MRREIQGAILKAKHLTAKDPKEREGMQEEMEDGEVAPVLVDWFSIDTDGGFKAIDNRIPWDTLPLCVCR